MVLVRMLVEVKDEVHTLGEFRWIHRAFLAQGLGILPRRKLKVDPNSFLLRDERRGSAR